MYHIKQANEISQEGFHYLDKILEWKKTNFAVLDFKLCTFEKKKSFSGQ